MYAIGTLECGIGRTPSSEQGKNRHALLRLPSKFERFRPRVSGPFFFFLLLSPADIFDRSFCFKKSESRGKELSSGGFYFLPEPAGGDFKKKKERKKKQEREGPVVQTSEKGELCEKTGRRIE